MSDGSYLRLMTWNMAGASPGPTASWSDVQAAKVDVALVQEAPDPWFEQEPVVVVPPRGGFWGIEGARTRARTAVAAFGDRVQVTEIPSAPLGVAGPGEVGISRMGTLAVAEVIVRSTGERLLVASVYGQWENPVPWRKEGFADGSMHRILADLEPLLVYRESPVILAGDFNHVLGCIYTAPGADWQAINDLVFDHVEALGFRLAGPQLPHGSAAENPAPHREGNRNVPTFRTSHGNVVNQLDYVYVTEELLDRTTVVAHNSHPEDWGPSDHCRITIELAPLV